MARKLGLVLDASAFKSAACGWQPPVEIFGVDSSKTRHVVGLRL
jgi:hypothetical protein